MDALESKGMTMDERILILMGDVKEQLGELKGGMTALLSFATSSSERMNRMDDRATKVEGTVSDNALSAKRELDDQASKLYRHVEEVKKGVEEKIDDVEEALTAKIDPLISKIAKWSGVVGGVLVLIDIAGVAIAYFGK